MSEQGGITTKKILDESPLAYLFLSLLGSAGIFYISALPGIVSALVDGLGFTEAEAGFAVSANAYGSMTGALLAVFLVRHVPWKKAMAGLLVLMIVLELATPLMSTPGLMTSWRFITGVAGGCSVGIGLSLLARLKHADRAFGTLLVLQFGLGGLVIYLRLAMVPILGEAGVFVMLAALMVLSLIVLPFLGDYKVDTAQQPKRFGLPPLHKYAALTMLAIFLYQASANGFWAYVERIGLAGGLSPSQVAEYVAIATWMGVPGGLLPIFLGVKIGRFLLIVSGLLLSLLGAIILYGEFTGAMFLLAGTAVNMSWSYVLAYFFGLAAHYDPTGQLSALGGTASKFGLATGPLVAASMLTGDGFDGVLLFSLIGFMLCLLAVSLPARNGDVELRRAAQ